MENCVPPNPHLYACMLVFALLLLTTFSPFDGQTTGLRVLLPGCSS